MAHFQLIEEKPLGGGSYGKVYECLWHGSRAAAKVFDVGYADDQPEMLKEIQILKELHNDYIIQFFGTANHNGKLCLITSYAVNGSLYHALEKHKPLAEQKPRIITGLIKGMQYLKGNNVVHRDFKSPNVLLASDNIPKICDFGLAKLKQISTTQTKPSSAVGTTRWMAPELFQLRPRYSFESDVYALGIVIWEIWTERVPYADITDMDTVRGLIKDGEHEEIPDDIPELYKDIIKKCWCFVPETRITVEEISKINDNALMRGDATVDLIVFNEEMDSVEALDVGSGKSGIVLSQQTQIALSKLAVRDIPQESESNDYTEILNQYLMQTSDCLDSKDHLVLVLKKYKDNFTQWIKEKANQDNIAAATMLGEMYYHGCGVTGDYEAAFKQFSMAAKEESTFDEIGTQRSARAQNNLGRMYQDGRGVSQNHKEAVMWYEKAAEQGFANAQNNLGLMYQYGLGVSQSDNEAAKWYIKAAEKGYANAQNNLAWMYQEGRGVPQSDYKAVDLYKKAAEQGDMYAQNSLGWMYEIGRGISKDENKAVKWYEKAVEQGYALAQKNLGEMYQYGRGVPKNVYKAVELYKAAAKQGNVEAQNSMNFIYHSGQGV